jgi:hypothetical protein
MTVLGLLLIAEPAHAQRLQWGDRTGDVWLENDRAGTTNPAPKATNGDVRHVAVRYGRHALRLTVRFVDLRRTGDSVAIKGDVRVPRGPTWHFGVGGRPGDWRGTADLIGPAFQPVPCGLSSRIDYSANTMRIGIPTACMKNPRWVKVRFGSIHSFFHAMKIYLDDAASPEVGSLAWSPRIRRG